MVYLRRCCSCSSTTTPASEGCGHRFDAVILPSAGKGTSSLRNITHSFFRSTVGQVAQQPAQGHFRLSRLEAACERGLDALLGLGVAHTLAEESGIATEVLDWRERDRIDPLLDHDLADGPQPGDPTRRA